MNSLRPEIYGYHDYRVFLADWLAFKKTDQAKFSLRMLAKQAGLATGYLPMVLSGKRTLSSSALSKILPHLGLAANEISFLENLFVLGTTDRHEVRVATLDRMKKFPQYQKQNPNDTEVYQYLKHWHFVAIRELATLEGFRADPEWIQEQLGFAVSLKDVREAYAFLLEKGYLRQQADGRITSPEKSLACSGGIYRLALGNFHREVLTLAEKAIESVPSTERQIQGHTGSLSQKGYEKAVEIANKAIEEIRNLTFNDSEGDSVYHMEIALFPLTKVKREQK